MKKRLRTIRSFWRRALLAGRAEHGISTIEWVGLTAVLVMLLVSVTAYLSVGGNQLGGAVSDVMGQWALSLEGGGVGSGGGVPTSPGGVNASAPVVAVGMAAAVNQVAGEPEGSPLYLAPEQLTWEPESQSYTVSEATVRAMMGDEGGTAPLTRPVYAGKYRLTYQAGRKMFTMPPVTAAAFTVQNAIDAGDYQGAIDLAIANYDIEVHGRPLYEPTLSGSMTTKNGVIFLGPPAFAGPALLASTIARETVHVQQQLDGRWYVDVPGIALNMVEAYDVQLATAVQYNLSTAHIAAILSRRQLYFEHMPPVYVKAVKDGSYSIEPVPVTGS